MFITIQPADPQALPRLLNVAHIVQLAGETLKLSDGTTVRLAAESVLRLHSVLPRLGE